MACKTIATSGEDMDIINHYIDGFRAAMLMETACELGILDKVEAVPGGISSSDLARAEGWDQDVTSRFMDGLAALKFLSKTEGSPGNDVFKVTGPGRLLLKGVPGTILLIVPSLMSEMYPIMKTMAKVVKTGPETWDESEGQSGEGQSGEDFGPGMTFAGYQAVGACLVPYLMDIIKAFDLSKFKTVVDLGAGSGDFGFALRKTYPAMHITMSELPSVAEPLEKLVLSKGEQANVKVLSGSFLEVDLPKADLFIICYVLHYFNREKQITLTKKVFESTNPGGAFLIVEKILYNNKTGPATGNIWDAYCCADGESRMSSEAEYTNQLREAGFRDVQLARTNDDCPYDVMIGRKP